MDIKRLRVAIAVTVACVASGSACGSAPPVVAPPPRPHDLGEARAVEVIVAALRREGVEATGDWSVEVGGPEPLRVDLRLGGGSFGIEYVTRQDREDVPDLPAAPRQPELQILPGHGPDERAQVLLLDELAYRFYPGLEQAHDGRRSARQAEGRLARDVADFVVYVRGQGGP
jgi:hypothetical protein